MRYGRHDAALRNPGLQTFTYQERTPSGAIRYAATAERKRAVATEQGNVLDIQRHHKTGAITVWIVTLSGEDRLIRLDDLVSIKQAPAPRPGHAVE